MNNVCGAGGGGGEDGEKSKVRVFVFLSYTNEVFLTLSVFTVITIPPCIFCLEKAEQKRQVETF